MKGIQWIAVLAMAAAPTLRAWGHGHPIVVTQADNRLVVSGGVDGAADGYATQIYVETDSAGDPQDFFEPADFGPAIYWTVPGFQISGLAEDSGLYLQPLARPVKGTNPVETRVFWYWNPAIAGDDKVEVAHIGTRMQLRHSSTVNALLTPASTVAPSAVKFADPTAADMGFHNHDLMKYLLPYPLPPNDDGAYAFFARLTSNVNVYESSAPFLVVINNGGLDGLEMLDAAADINRKALLAGDYNHDDVVNGADYIVWRKTLNSTSLIAADGSENGIVDAADFGVWRDNYGAIFAANGLSSASIPEPRACVLLAGWIAIGWLVFGRTRVEASRQGR